MGGDTRMHAVGDHQIAARDEPGQIGRRGKGGGQADPPARQARSAPDPVCRGALLRPVCGVGDQAFAVFRAAIGEQDDMHALPRQGMGEGAVPVDQGAVAQMRGGGG